MCRPLEEAVVDEVVAARSHAGSLQPTGCFGMASAVGRLRLRHLKYLILVYARRGDRSRP